jgi:hypothetical protein
MNMVRIKTMDVVEDGLSVRLAALYDDTIPVVRTYRVTVEYK